ncbi:dihydroorotase [Chromatiales bacterium (ex Bugula neritina AB1)]|nr:dihydroorotase [Chromatiales bacterium (ex Bugula neritina AB1)]
MPQTLSICRPDDWHLHLRDGAILQSVLPATTMHFGRALIMPNLVPPVVKATDAVAYRQRIIAALPVESAFAPLMTLYLTEATDPGDVAAAAESGLITAVKLYPAGATTNSDSGVKDLNKVSAVLERMAEIGLPLCVHGEVTDADIDIFDREAIFIDRVLEPLRQRLPQLRVVMEHVTTKDGIDYVRTGGDNIAATLTTHHLMINRNHMLVGGIRPHYYCLPIVKRASHQRALRDAAVSGEKCFFLGTDSAPHLDGAKESACGCAGVFNAPNALSCLAHVFEEENALHHLEAFASLNGPAFYRLPANTQTVTLEKVPGAIAFDGKLETPDGSVTVFDPAVDLHWRVKEA